MSRRRHGGTAGQGPSQRQLRAAELIRHALVDILREEDIHHPALADVSVTVTEVRLSPDLKHAICFIQPLGAGIDSAPAAGMEDEVVRALNDHARYLRGLLGRHIDMKFTPDLRFRHDESFDAAARMDALLSDPRIRADVEATEDDLSLDDEAGQD